MTAEGLVEVNGQIEGDVHCTTLIVSPKAQIVGSITAERVVVNVEWRARYKVGEVALKSHAHVVGDIRHQSLTIEKGACFDGRASQAHGSNGSELTTVGKNKLREVSREANTPAE